MITLILAFSIIDKTGEHTDYAAVECVDETCEVWTAPADTGVVTLAGVVVDEDTAKDFSDVSGLSHLMRLVVDGSGYQAQPEMDAGILVAYASGDLADPVWTGDVWNQSTLTAEQLKESLDEVRTHIDDEAGEAAKEMDATAYAAGKMVTFGQRDLVAIVTSKRQ